MADFTIAGLAARISALVDRWNTRENQMIDFISAPASGDPANPTLVTVTDGLDTDHQLKSFPQLEQDVQDMLDDGSGAVVSAQASASQAIASANAAQGSAQDAAASAASIVGDKDAAAASANAAAASASAADASATQASTSASDAAASATAASASAATAATEADSAGDDAIAAAQSAQAAADSATQAGQAAAGKLAWFGVWNISGGALPPDALVPGFYLVSGTATISGEKYADGDMLVWGEESSWHRIDNQQTVASVAGMVGTITVGQLQAALNLGSAAYQNVAAFATAAQGTKADAAMPVTGGNFTGAINVVTDNTPTQLLTLAAGGTHPYHITMSTDGIGSAGHVWWDGSFNFDAQLKTANITTSGMMQISGNQDSAIANAAGGMGALWCYNANPTVKAAFLTFHRAGAYACYFGLDTDNQLKVGGWSMGNVAFTILHEGTVTWSGKAAITTTGKVTANGFVTAGDWYRSAGATGWYNDTYAGGWYMTDATYVRSYSNKAVMASDFVISSDRKLKRDITDMAPRAPLRPRTFTMRDTGKHTFGFVAQEVEEFYPEAVGEMTDEHGETTKQVSYSILTAALAAQVNALRDEVAQLKARLDGRQ